MKSRVVFSSHSDEWRTPESVYNALNEEFSFDYDPCPLGDNLAFIQPWGKRCFVNPPYSDIKRFLQRAIHEIKAGHTEIAVFLIPSRTSNAWWHDYVMPHASEIRFIRGRLKFGDQKYYAPFPSCIVVFKQGEESQ